LFSARHQWARTSVEERLAILQQIKDALLEVAAEWAMAASKAKGLMPGDPLAGEEWLAGPGAMMAGCNGLINTLELMERKAFLARIPRRRAPGGRVSLRVTPANLWDQLLLSGVSADVW